MATMAHRVQVEEVAKTDTYRLIVFNRAGTAVLLESHYSGYDLPFLDIPRFTRPAQEITTFLRERWHIPSVVLFSDVLEQNLEPVYFAALEAQIRTCSLPEGMDWFPVHHAISHLLTGKTRSGVESSYLRTTNRMVGDDPEPFSRLGWLRNLQDRVRTVIRPLGMELKGFQQLNGCETFSLIRFDTTHRPVWFKAVGKPNLHEFSISVALSRMFPEYLPSLLGTQPTCHGWLMADAGGLPLNEVGEPSAWKDAATALAGLQTASMRSIDDLLEVGCRDLRAAALLELVDPFLEVMADLMPKQTKVPPPILTREELLDLGLALKDALHCLAALKIPDTLGHKDFNPGNIIMGSERCTFLDWAEAHVGHPFLTCEYLLAHLRKDYSELVLFESEVRASYSRIWSSVTSPEQIAETYLFSPLVAAFAYAASSHAWRDPDRLKVPRFQGYLRSLTRKMKQEADLLQRRRVECPN